MSATLQREHWNGQATLLGDLFRVTKPRGDKQLAAASDWRTVVASWHDSTELKVRDECQ
jgi:hypothetical protein